MSKYRFSHSSIYIDGTSVPKNKFNIKSPELIAEVEKLHLDDAYKELSNEINSKTILNEFYFINLHKKSFESCRVLCLTTPLEGTCHKVKV